MMFKVSTFFVTLCIVGYVSCWDAQELQMFDLVEEVKENFYDYLGVNQNATVGEIGKAYRKLTLRYHPDKNPGVEFATKFQHLVAIYEILKDEQLRERYHDVLKHGLPDWRTSTFYYRKLRKMPIFEIIGLFSILATLIHYACLWGVYFEKKLDMEESLEKLFRRRKKQEKKKGKDDAENEMNQQLKTIPKPIFKDILPFVIVRFIYYSVVSTPVIARDIFDITKKEVLIAIDKKLEKKRNEKAKEEERKRMDEMKKQKKERKIALSKDQLELRKNYELAKRNAMVLPIETFADLPSEIHEKNNTETESIPLGPWTDEYTIVLIKALAKYPSGVNERWVKISEMVKRPVSEVTAKVKEIQQKSREGKKPIQQRMQSSLGEGVADQIEQDQQKVMYIPNILDHDESESSIEEDDESNIKSKAQLKKERKKMAKQTVSSTVIKKLEDVSLISAENEDKENNTNEEESNVHMRKKPRKKESYLESGESVENVECVWSQVEQKQLEDAMRTFPNGTSNRWDRISQKIPTKTKAQCIERIKKLSQAVHSKQSTDT